MVVQCSVDIPSIDVSVLPVIWIVYGPVVLEASAAEARAAAAKAILKVILAWGSEIRLLCVFVFRLQVVIIS